MDFEGWGKLISLVGVPAGTLIALGYAFSRFMKWLAPHADKIGSKAVEFFSVLIDFVRGTETRLAALEKSQSQMVLQVNEIHVEVVQRDQTRKTRILEKPVDPGAHQ